MASPALVVVVDDGGFNFDELLVASGAKQPQSLRIEIESMAGEHASADAPQQRVNARRPKRAIGESHVTQKDGPHLRGP
jgi:hypothetical protein